MSRFPQYLRQHHQAADQANVDRATRDSHLADTPTHQGATAGGDARKLRGIPAIGRNVRGAIPGSVPGDNLWR